MLSYASGVVNLTQPRYSPLLQLAVHVGHVLSGLTRITR